MMAMAGGVSSVHRRATGTSMQWSRWVSHGTLHWLAARLLRCSYHDCVAYARHLAQLLRCSYHDCVDDAVPVHGCDAASLSSRLSSFLTLCSPLLRQLLSHCFTTHSSALQPHTHTLTHSHTFTISCTCCYDEIKGAQDQDLFSCSFSDSLYPFLCLPLALYPSFSCSFSDSLFLWLSLQCSYEMPSCWRHCDVTASCFFIHRSPGAFNFPRQ